MDALVLGNSIKSVGTKARMVACLEPETLKLPMAEHLTAFWDIMPVQPLQLPDHLLKQNMEHLRGVYNKLQVWKVFDQNDQWKARRVCMLDADMMMRSNCDEIWNFTAPAGVMRGNTDTAMHCAPLQNSFFLEGRFSSVWTGKTKNAWRHQ